MAKLICGVNDLATVFPEIAKEWHPTLNGDLTPQKVTRCSGKKVWWLGACGHEWDAKISNRTVRNDQCPYCSGHRTLAGFNDLQTTNPELASEWHPTKNGNFKPTQTSYASNDKVWWKCEHGHEWEAVIANRSKGSGCPYCSGRNVIQGKTDLFTINPSLASEWHPTKNEGLSPLQVAPGSHNKVWWLCRKGHEWPAIIGNRAKGVGCPFCAGELNTSFPEQAILYYMGKATIAESRSTEFGVEIDVWLPELSTGIEYNGYWHSSPKKQAKDVFKFKYLNSKNVRLIVVKEGSENRVSNDVIEYAYNSTYRNLDWVIYTLFSLLNLSAPRIDITADAAAIFEQYIQNEKRNSLLAQNPTLAAEWHPTKNGKLNPEMISPGSDKKVWWQCENSHEWQAAVVHRSHGHGCPYCSGRNVIQGKNDLATVKPELAAEWHPAKNDGLLASEVAYSSNKKAWWLCLNGHEWNARISSRSEGNGCPFCARKKPKK